MPGGKIAFYEGLIKAFQNEVRTFGVGGFTLEERVAAVMAHEIVHAAARHSTTIYEFGLLVSFLLTAFYEGITFIFRDEEGDLPDNLPWIVELILDKLHTYSVLLTTTPISRAAEFEADKYGMVYLQRAGYNPEVAVWLQEYLASQEISTENKVLDWALSFFSTHPDSKARGRQQRDLEIDPKRRFTLNGACVRIIVMNLHEQRALLFAKKPVKERPLRPLSHYHLAGSSEYSQKGQALIAAGKVGCIILAGGQGSRLGAPLPQRDGASS